MCNTDTISWPKDFVELKRLDVLLRCGICYDYMKTSMMTSCLHNYCSLCIRKYMQYKSVCPTCYEETYEINLRNNRTLDEIISLFTTIRDKILRHLRLAAVHVSKSDEVEDTTFNTPSIPKLSSKLSNEKASTSKEKNVVRRLDKVKEVVTDTDDSAGINVLTSPTAGQSPRAHQHFPNIQGTPVTKIPSIFYSPKKTPASSPASTSAVPTVLCPVCNVDIPERNINVHLDNCLARENSPHKSNVKCIKRNPIPKRVYSIMTEKDLRKWLKTYGLNTIGDKKVLINRLQRYTVLFNSECDSDNPREVSEIIRQVEKEEKDEKLASSGLGVVVRKQINRNTDPKILEEENKKYLEKNKSNFQNLISAMKERYQKNIKPTRCTNRVYSDDSDIEDSYCNKETQPVANNREAAFSKPHPNEVLTSALEPDVILQCDDQDDIIEISPESPDLSNTKVASGKCVVKTPDHCSYVEPIVSIKNCNSISPEKSDCSKFNGKLLEKKETLECSDERSTIEVVCKLEDSDCSNESFSLLTNYQDPDKESELIIDAPKKTEVSDSQIADPDFTITDTELNCLCEDSEDVFVKRSKRPRNNSPEISLPKRVLRKRTK